MKQHTFKVHIESENWPQYNKVLLLCTHILKKEKGDLNEIVKSILLLQQAVFHNK